MLAGEQQLLEAAGGVLEEDRLARVAQLGRQAEQPLVVLLVPDLELVRLVYEQRVTAEGLQCVVTCLSAVPRYTVLWCWDSV